MKLITSRIYTAKPTKTVDDLIKEAQAKTAAGQTKTASSKATTKEANLANFGDKKAKPFGKEEGKKDKESTCEKCKGEDCKCKKEDAKPCMAKAESKEVEVKIAEEKGVETTDTGKKEGKDFTNDAKKEPQDAKKPEKESGKAATTSTKTKDGTFPSSGQPQWEGKAENNNKPEMPNDKNTKASTESKVKLGVPEGRFQLVANLTPELKKKTKDYWRAIYGDAYAEAMVADK